MPASLTTPASRRCIENSLCILNSPNVCVRVVALHHPLLLPVFSFCNMKVRATYSSYLKTFFLLKCQTDPLLLLMARVTPNHSVANYFPTMKTCLLKILSIHLFTHFNISHWNQIVVSHITDAFPCLFSRTERVYWLADSHVQGSEFWLHPSLLSSAVHKRPLYLFCDTHLLIHSMTASLCCCRAPL